MTGVLLPVALSGPIVAASTEWWEGMGLLAVVTCVAGAINSVAGGGTILTFPVLALLLADHPAGDVTANATSTLGLLPGSLAAAWASRGQRQGLPEWTRGLLVVSVFGAVAGTLLVLLLPPAWFSRAVPWLILSAAILFSLQPRLAALGLGAALDASPSAATVVVARVLQFLVAVYGGYFGAGIGILMLAVLGCLGLGDIHRLNAVKNAMATAVNGTTATVFLLAACLPAGLAAGPWGGTVGPGLVSWPHVATMAVASAAGGIVGVHLASRLPARIVRRVVALIGFGLAGYHLVPHWARTLGPLLFRG